MLSRIWSLVIKEFIHLRNDWWLPAFMLLGGTMELLAVGWATSRPITNLPLMVLDYDKSSASREVVQALINTGTFRLQSQVEDMEPIEVGLDTGTITAAVIIPADFSEQIAASNGKPVLPILLNGAESIPATAALRAIEGVTRDYGEKVVIERLGLDPDSFSGLNFSLRVWFNEALKEALYSTPAELALMLEFTVLLFAALSLSRERELGTLEQLLVMPFSSFEIIAGKSIPVVLVGFIDFVLMLGVTHFVFEVPIRGSLTLLLILACFYLLVELGKGMVISVIAHTQHQAFMMVMMIGMIDFMFTGYAVPVESMPMVLQKLAWLIPAHHWLAIVRGILIKSSTLDVLLPHIAALAVLGIIIGSFSLNFVRRALD